MNQEFLLPDLGEGLPEAELVQWLVAEGETVTLNQTIAEVETAKAVVELPSPYAGTVSALHAQAGDVIAVGSALISFDIAGDAQSDEPASQTAESASAEEAEAVPPNLVGYGAAVRSAAPPRRRARRLAAAAAGGVDTAVLEAAPHDVLETAEVMEPALERPKSTPPVRRLAKDLGVELALVPPTGEAGVITRADVEQYAARVGASPSPATSRTDETTREELPETAAALTGGTAPRERRIPIRGVRKHTAEAMVRSAFTAPHVTTFLTVDVTETSELIASLKADRALEGHRIGILAVAAKAVCLALPRTPELNANWDEAAGEIVEYASVNLGVAAATPRGLVVPVVREADSLTLTGLADAIAELAGTARAGKTPPADMMGGTFSITNVGVFGVDAGTPIINPGEAGILALGALRRQPWEHHGEIALRDVLTLSLSFDHRLVDGEQGARFLRDVGDVLRQPGRAMLLA